MTDFTRLFTETLNATLAKMVDEVTARQTEIMQEMQGKIMALEEQIAWLSDESAFAHAVESALDNVDFDDKIKDALDDYGLDDKIREVVDLTGLLDETAFEQPEFERAVRRVIAEALG